MIVQRVRIRFEKRGGLRAISHLDLMRLFERALRRTGLPLRMSEGFHPKPRISFPAPLGVGIEGADEVMEFGLAKWVHPSEIEARLTANLPAGIAFRSLHFGVPTQAARAVGATYMVRLNGELRRDERLSNASLQEVMAQPEILVRRIRKRKEKTVNIRPFVTALRRHGETMMMEVTAGPGGSTRPEELLRALGFDAETCASQVRITRTRVSLAPPPGKGNHGKDHARKRRGG